MRLATVALVWVAGIALAVLAALVVWDRVAYRDVHFEPVPGEVIPYVLELAGVRAGDVVFELGCGDGRIAVEAARRPGVRVVCVEHDPAVLQLAAQRARAEGVLGQLELVETDLFSVDLAQASVVVVFLSPSMNARLLPKLRRELRSGARVVSIWHDFDGWKAVAEWRVTALDKLYPVRMWVQP